MPKQLSKLMWLLLMVFWVFSVQSTANAFGKKVVVEFEGNKVFSSATLVEKLNFCLSKYSNSEDKYNANLYNYCLRKDVLGLLRSHGYLSAKVGEPEVKGEKSLKITVPIVEGTLYRLGSVKIEGAKVFMSEQLLEKLNLKTGDIANGQIIFEWLYERVKKLYGDSGYIQSDFDLEPKFKFVAEKETEGIADFEVSISEGSRFIIDRIEFVGNKQTSDQVLRSALLIKEDEPFCQQRFVESIEKLNDLGLFEKIDKDREVELHIDNESPLLNIKIRVKERNSF